MTYTYTITETYTFTDKDINFWADIDFNNLTAIKEVLDNEYDYGDLHYYLHYQGLDTSLIAE